MNLISREMIFHDVQTSKITWPIEEYIFSPNDNKTLSIQGYNLRIWDLKLISQSEWQFEGARIKGWFSPDNERVLACISDYYHSDRTTFYEFDLNQITAFHKFSLGSDYFVSSFSPNGKYILAQDNNNKICLCNLNLDLIVEFNHDAQINYFAFSPNNQYILSLDDVLLNIWNINGELKSKYIFDTGVKIDAHFSPDSENILLAGHGNPILVNLSGEKLVEYNHGEEGTRYADFSPDGQKIITISNAAKLWEINGKLITTLDNKRIGVASFRVGRGIK